VASQTLPCQCKQAIGKSAKEQVVEHNLDIVKLSTRIVTTYDPRHIHHKLRISISCPTNVVRRQNSARLDRKYHTHGLLSCHLELAASSNASAAR
jgi:hypothetical protein